MRKLMLLLLTCAPLFAQLDMCSFMSAGGSKTWSCSDHDPAETISVYFCEWITDSATGIQYVQPGDLVDLTVSRVHGSGFHVHDGFPTYAPLPIWKEGPFVMNSLQTVQGITASTGCFTKTLLMTGYAGSYPIMSFSHTGWPSYTHIIAAHFLNKNVTDKPKLLSYSSITMKDFATHFDPFHNVNASTADTFWVKGNTDASYIDMALNYYTLSFGTPIEIVRGGLPEGGKSDNDPKTNIGYPGYWDASFRTFEDHAAMDAIDVVNPSVIKDISGIYITNPGDPNKDLFDTLSVAVDATVPCALGAFQPGSPYPAGVAATYDYWSSNPFIHVECGFESIKIPPFCGVIPCSN